MMIEIQSLSDAGKKYRVDPEKRICSCKAWKYQRKKPWERHCKHLASLGIQPPVVSSYYPSKTTPPDLMLLHTDPSSIKEDWLWSVKYDGIRVLWNGEALLSRGGMIIEAPFKLPKGICLDGELVVNGGAKGNSRLSTNLIYEEKKSSKWEDAEFLVFDSPSYKRLPFSLRYKKLKHLFDKKKIKNVSLVRQEKIGDLKNIEKLKTEIQRINGEGIVLRNGESLPYIGRRKMCVKIK